jgi:hypothetical protein
MFRCSIFAPVAIWSVCLSLPLVSLAQQSLVEFRLETTDLLGNPISSVERDHPFLLRGYVADLRTESAEGVFAAFMDVTFDPTLALVAGSIDYGPTYSVGVGGTFAAGEIDEIGGISNQITALGPAQRLLFSVPFMAGQQTGTLHFFTNPADLFPVHNTLIYGLASAIPAEQINYGNSTIVVVPEPSTMALGVLAVCLSALHLSRSRWRQAR